MNPLWPDLSRIRAARAAEAFREAEILQAGGGLRGAANRYYYAAFYAARALLALDGFDSSRHRGILSEFGRLYAKTGAVSGEAGRALNVLFEACSEADYEDDRTFELTEIERLRGLASLVLDEVSHALESRGVDLPKTASTTHDSD